MKIGATGRLKEADRRQLGGSLYTEECSAKRTQLKNAHVFRHETVMKKQSWVRSAKKRQKTGNKCWKTAPGGRFSASFGVEKGGPGAEACGGFGDSATLPRLMKVRGKDYRAVWMRGRDVVVINQPLLPHKFELLRLKNHRETADAIKTMIIRGAGTIGATAGYGMAQAYLEGRGSRPRVSHTGRDSPNSSRLETRARPSSRPREIRERGRRRGRGDCG